MADNISLDEEQPRRRWLPILGAIVAGLLVLLVVAYFVISSSAFLKGVILPKVGQALHSQVTVADASLSPFSQLTLDQLKVQPNGAEPLLTAQQVRVRYSLLSILRGNYVVNELTLVDPVIQIVKEPNGTSNLDPVTQGAQGKTSSKPSEGPMQLAVHNVAIKNGVVRTVERAKDGSSKRSEFSHLDLNLDQLANGQAGKLTVAAGLGTETRPATTKANATNDVLEGKVNGIFDFKLTPNLLPQSVKGSAQLALARTEGAFADLAGLGASLDVEMTPTDVRQLALRFQRQGQPLGQVRASGPLDVAKTEGRLTVEVLAIDRQVLNFVGASHGWDFGSSTLSSTNYLDIMKQGTVLAAKGQLNGRQLTIRQLGTTTPPMDLDVDYDVSVNRTDEAAVLSKANISGRQEQKEVLRASLDRPMTLSWAKNAHGIPVSQFQLALTQFDLKDWRPLLGTNLLSGRLDLNLNLGAEQDGRSLTAKGQASLQNLRAQVGTNRLDESTLNLRLDGVLQSLKTLDLQQYALELLQANQTVAKASGSIHYEISGNDLSLQANAELVLEPLLRQFPVAQVTASNGVLRLTSAITQKNQKQSLTGSLSLAEFTGRYGAYAFDNFQAGLDYGVNVQRPEVEIQSASLTLRNGYSSGGNVSLTGKYQIDQGSAQGTFKLVDLNQNALAPILAPSLGERKLVSISLNGNGSASYDPRGDSALKAELSLTNWVVADPKQSAPLPPLAVQAVMDGAMHQQVVDLKQLLLKLSPTQLAKNEVALQGRLDLNKTNASPSQLKLDAESVDLTPYYNLFAGAKTTNAPRAASPSTPPPPSKPGPATEPAPAQLPCDPLNADLKIGRLYLRDVAVTNLQAAIKLNKGELTMKPMEMTLNGAPVSAAAVLNLGVPGYVYDLSFNANRVPVEPLVTSFSTMSPGELKGDLFAQAQFKGAGVTDASLRKNLSGALDFNLTNMNYQVVGPKIRRLLEPISVVLRVPELMQTPLNWINAKANVASGQIDLQQFSVVSQAFEAQSHGTIPMAEKLTNSPLKLPVVLSLRRSLAERANLVPPNTPTNTEYVPLPAFVTLAGTLGDPKSEINKLVIGGLLARSIGGIVPVGDKAGSILQGVGGLLAGQGTVGKTNAPGATSTNAAAALVEGIGSLIGQPKNQAGTNTAPAAAKTNSAASLLEGLFGQPKKTRAATNAPAASTNKTARPSAPGSPEKSK